MGILASNGSVKWTLRLKAWWESSEEPEKGQAESHLHSVRVVVEVMGLPIAPQLLPCLFCPPLSPVTSP